MASGQTLGSQFWRLVLQSHWLVPAACLFVATIYAPFTVVALIGGQDPSTVPYILVTVLLSMAVGTAASAMRTRMALVIAPAIGMAALFTQVLDSKALNMSELLLSGVFAGVACFLLSWRVPSQSGGKETIRFKLLQRIPDEIKLGVKGGVGILLASAAVDSAHCGGNSAAASLIVGILVLLVCDFAMKRLDPAVKDWRYFVLRSSTLWVPLLILLVVCLWPPGGKSQLGVFSSFTWAGWRQFLLGPESLWGNFSAGLTSRDWTTMICLAAILVFVFMTDIPGTPYEILGSPKKPDTRDLEAIQNSFVVDSGMAVFNAVLRVSPSIYYAENFIIKDFDADVIRSRIPALLCALFYLIVAITLLIVPLPVDLLRDYSMAAVAPVLLLIGVKVTANAMVAEHERPGEAKPTSPGDFYYYLPAATTVIFTHFVGLTLALPIGVIVYWLYVFFTQKVDHAVHALSVASALLLLLWWVFGMPWLIDHSCPADRTAVFGPWQVRSAVYQDAATGERAEIAAARMKTIKDAPPGWLKLMTAKDRPVPETHMSAEPDTVWIEGDRLYAAYPPRPEPDMNNRTEQIIIEWQRATK